MSSNDPFGPGGPFNDPFKKQREQAEMFKRLLGPGYALQQRMKALEGPLAHYRTLEQSGVIGQIAALQNSSVLNNLLTKPTLHAESIAVLQARATPSWMLALQSTALGVAQNDVGITKTQQLLAASAAPNILKLAGLLDTNRSFIEKMLVGSKWTEQFKALTERFGPSLEGVRLAAERARLLDMQILRASAEAAATSTVAIVAEQVLEAHGLIEAIGQADNPAQSLTLFAQLLSLIGALFSGLQENTLKELRGVGAFRLIELILMSIAIFHMVVPAEPPAVDRKMVQELKVEVESLQEKLDKIVAANEEANTAYIANLPRAELKRDAAIRREPKGKAPVLMHAPKGTQLAVKETCEKWRLVVYHDLLTDQLSEGWIYAPAVQMLDEPAS